MLDENVQCLFEEEESIGRTQGSSQIAKIKIDQNRKTRLQILDMWCKIVREKCRDSKKIFCTMSFFVNQG